MKVRQLVTKTKNPKQKMSEHIVRFGNHQYKLVDDDFFRRAFPDGEWHYVHTVPKEVSEQFDRRPFKKFKIRRPLAETVDRRSRFVDLGSRFVEENDEDMSVPKHVAPVILEDDVEYVEYGTFEEKLEHHLETYRHGASYDDRSRAFLTRTILSEIREGLPMRSRIDKKPSTYCSQMVRNVDIQNVYSLVDGIGTGSAIYGPTEHVPAQLRLQDLNSLSSRNPHGISSYVIDFYTTYWNAISLANHCARSADGTRYPPVHGGIWGFFPFVSVLESHVYHHHIAKDTEEGKTWRQYEWEIIEPERTHELNAILIPVIEETGEGHAALIMVKMPSEDEPMGELLYFDSAEGDGGVAMRKVRTWLAEQRDLYVLTGLTNVERWPMRKSKYVTLNQNFDDYCAVATCLAITSITNGFYPDFTSVDVVNYRAVMIMECLMGKLLDGPISMTQVRERKKYLAGLNPRRRRRDQ